jgi:hypothetical protein
MGKFHSRIARAHAPIASRPDSLPKALQSIIGTPDHTLRMSLLQATRPSTEARPEHREPPAVRAPARWHPATEAIYAVIFAACLVAAVVLLSG